MSEKLRTRAQVDQEYQIACCELGDCEFKIKFLENRIKLLFVRLHELNQEPVAAPEAPLAAVVSDEEVKIAEPSKE